MVVALILFLFLANGNVLVEYRLGYNFGQVFHDYSGHGNDGINGDSIGSAVNDAFITDRGIYLSDLTSYIKSPYNEKVPININLSTAFCFSLWVMAAFDEDGCLLQRTKDSNNLLSLGRDKKSNKITFKYLSSVTTIYDKTIGNNFFKAGI